MECQTVGRVLLQDRACTRVSTQGQQRFTAARTETDRMPRLAVDHGDHRLMVRHGAGHG